MNKKINPSAVENARNFFHLLSDFGCTVFHRKGTSNSIEICKQWETVIKLLINVLNEATRSQDHNINYNLSFHYCSTDVI